ncbi:response regulator receiver protein [Leptolyngbya sp. Heron Island J]|uniref:response regulator transcription factor n=1 Tax=Leptolyngbya sp. Heron Island J TaxID=1385935 RepID=UPI0003B9F781|nr:response regulator [Leptolyngbya sp. Heron Island J]ESA38773.1 response regulator receiver protein [Leptolyngbya sp. Heron Island J]
MVKLLIIEDEVEIRANLLELLKLEGYSVVGADNGMTGLIGAMEHTPDLIICDVMMPKLDGYDVLRALRQEPKTMGIPFIFLTALTNKSDIRRGMVLGADDYLTKPFTRSEVLSAVESRLQKQAISQAQISELQKESQLLHAGLNNDQTALLKDMRQQLNDAVVKLDIVINTLKTLPPSEQRERSIALVQNVCAAEIKMLGRVPNLEYLLETTLT